MHYAYLVHRNKVDGIIDGVLLVITALDCYCTLIFAPNRGRFRLGVPRCKKESAPGSLILTDVQYTMPIF